MTFGGVIESGAVAHLIPEFLPNLAKDLRSPHPKVRTLVCLQQLLGIDLVISCAMPPLGLCAEQPKIFLPLPSRVSLL